MKAEMREIEKIMNKAARKENHVMLMRKKNNTSRATALVTLLTFVLGFAGFPATRAQAAVPAGIDPGTPLPSLFRLCRAYSDKNTSLIPMFQSDSRLSCISGFLM